MNQNQKTAAFLAAALAAVVLAWEPWRTSAKLTESNDTVVKLFPKFTDPFAAKSLQVMDYDQDTGTLRPFSIQQVNGRWVIPSHENYPADAREHLAAAATSVLGLESLNKVSSSPGEFELYGVIDPDIKSLKLGTVGVGSRVTLKDGDKVLADLIIGKKVKDQPELRYVRMAGRDQVYVVKLNTDKLSTNFSDWIEKDLLKLNAFDIRQVRLNDYSIDKEVTQEGLVLDKVRRSNMTLDYDDEKSAWSLADFVEYKKRSPVSSKLKDDEELNTEKLNAMRSALDDLQIVDVERKPKGLSRDLRVSDEFVKDRAAVNSLMERGFYAIPGENGGIEILSSEGEVFCLIKDGVEYILRFGQIAVNSGDQGKDDDGKKDKKKNRYLFVTCQLHEDSIPKPQLEEVPTELTDGADTDKPAKPADEVKPDAAAPADKPAADKPPADKPSTDKPDAGKDGGSQPDAKKPDSKKPDGKQAAVGNAVFRLTAADEKVVKKPAADDATADKAPADSATEKPAGDKAEKTGDASSEEPAGGKIRAKARDAKALAEKQAAVEKENKRKLDEYNEKLKKAQDHAKELNDRFADWYYVISDDVYHKIHLSRSDVVKQKETPAGKGDGIGDFKALQQGLPPHDHDHDHDKPKGAKPKSAK